MAGFLNICRFGSLPCLALALLGLAWTALAEDLRPPGFRPWPPGVHALVGGTVVVRPGETITNGTILVRDGLIQAVGTHLAIPDDARVWDMTSNTIYAGFIEPYFVEEATNPPIYTDDSEPVNQRTLAAGGYSFFGTSGDLANGNKAGPGGFWPGFTPE